MLLAGCNLDECTAGTHNCDQNATCANTLDSFACMCRPGFVGDGTVGNCIKNDGPTAGGGSTDVGDGTHACFLKQCGCPPFTNGPEWCNEEKAFISSSYCQESDSQCNTCGGDLCAMRPAPTPIDLSPSSQKSVIPSQKPPASPSLRPAASPSPLPTASPSSSPSEEDMSSVNKSFRMGTFVVAAAALGLNFL